MKYLIKGPEGAIRASVQLPASKSISCLLYTSDAADEL